MFKQALAKRDFDSVLRLIRSGKLCGTAIIAFLRKKGFPEVRSWLRVSYKLLMHLCPAFCPTVRVCTALVREARTLSSQHRQWLLRVGRLNSLLSAEVLSLRDAVR